MPKMTQSAPNLHSELQPYTERSLAALRAELDPNNTHGPRKLWSALKATGLEAEDVDAGLNKTRMRPLHEKVPAATAPRITQHREKIWEDLRQSRIRQVMAVLDGDGETKSLGANEVRRYEKVDHGGGVRAVRPDDLPPVAELGSMDQFNAIQAASERKVREQQQKKAKTLGEDFLREKRRMEEADRKIMALEDRLKAYAKEREDALKAKKLENQKKQEKMQASVARAQAARAEWEAETEEEMNTKMTGANKRRSEFYSKEALRDKIESNNAKREDAYRNAVEKEERMLEVLEEKRVALEERLEQDRMEQEEKLALKKEASQAQFQRRQVKIHAMQQEWVDNKLAEHDKFKRHIGDCRAKRSELQKEVVKATGDRQRKAAAKAQAANQKLAAAREEALVALAERYQKADERREELNDLRIKNENDIYTFREIKYNTFGELHRRRHQENKCRRDAQMQALVFKIAENRAKEGAKDQAQEDLLAFRQKVAKDAMTFSDRAAEGFILIQRESDEMKVRQMMENLGFEMPKLPEDEEGDGEEAPAKAPAF